jgi:hypothetical protein
VWVEFFAEDPKQVDIEGFFSILHNFSEALKLAAKDLERERIEAERERLRQKALEKKQKQMEEARRRKHGLNKENADADKEKDYDISNMTAVLRAGDYFARRRRQMQNMDVAEESKKVSTVIGDERRPVAVEDLSLRYTAKTDTASSLSPHQSNDVHLQPPPPSQAQPQAQPQPQILIQTPTLTTTPEATSTTNAGSDHSTVNAPSIPPSESNNDNQNETTPTAKSPRKRDKKKSKFGQFMSLFSGKKSEKDTHS